MTALTQYQRLETVGIWKADKDAQRKDVVVSFGNATLVLSKTNDQPLTHWSLAAVNRLNPGERPAIFAPDADGSETLEIDDPDMIDAIGQIRKAIAQSKPRPGRLRYSLTALGLIVGISLSVFWLPTALTQYAASIVPEVKRVEIGASLLDRISHLSGNPCASTYGVKALNRLRERVLAPDDKLAVLPAGVRITTHLPGGFILLNRSLVEDPEDPAVTSGYLLAEQWRRTQIDPLERLLSSAGLSTTLKLMMSGNIEPDVLQHYAEGLLITPLSSAPDEALLAEFAKAEISSTPYGYALDVTGETTLALIEGDPMAGQTTAPVLTDGQWISLQSICGA
ncbi:MAG: hypothetical protein ABJO27_21080 [Pseudoruegeria sp.]